CGRPAISKGLLGHAQDLARRQIQSLAARIADKTPILGLEPSCLLTLADEWPELVPSLAAQQVADNVKLADAWIAERVREGVTALPVKSQRIRCLLHPHCHQKALCGTDGSVAALSLIPDLDVQVLDAGCCGMAGSFGFEKEHYDISVKIAGLQLVPALNAEPDT